MKDVDDETKLKNEWVDLFDLVVVGSCKPAYLVDPYLNLFRVNPRDGSLLNTDGVFEIKSLGENGAQEFLEQGKIFQGGNWQVCCFSIFNLQRRWMISQKSQFFMWLLATSLRI